MVNLILQICQEFSRMGAVHLGMVKLHGNGQCIPEEALFISSPDQKRIVRDLKDCADTIHDTDLRMLRIRNRITDKKPDPSEEDLLYEKFMKLDIKVE